MSTPLILGEALDGLGLLVEDEDAEAAAPRAGGGWDLLAIVRGARADAAQAARERPVACPNDGEPLVTGRGGRLRCPFDGWEPRL